MNANNHPERVLTLKINGPAVADGKMSLSALAVKLDAAQKTLYNIALAFQGGQVATRGNWSRNIKSACELVFVASKGGSVTISTELSDNDVFPGMNQDFGPQVLTTLKNVVVALNTSDSDSIVRLLPDSTARVRALKSLETLCPRDGDGFVLELSNGDGLKYGALSYYTRNIISSFFQDLAEDISSDIVTVGGTLVEIRVKAGSRHIVVLSRQREITCIYSSEKEGMISQLVAGSIVEVKGKAQLNSDQSIKQIDDVLDATMIDVTPFRLRRFYASDRVFVLSETASCTLDYRNDLWVYECEKYKLHTFDHRRDVAFAQLGEEFSVIYDGLHAEPDESLTKDAIELRDRIKRDVSEVLDKDLPSI